MSNSNHYSYFIIKPDGARFLEDICNNIESKYEKVKYYAICDFEKIIKKLYHKHYEQKGMSFSNSFDSYLYGLKEIFGNEPILVLVQESREPYDKLIQSVFNTKKEIRSKYVNNNVGLVTNYGNGQSYIRFLTEAGETTEPRIMTSLGSYRINDMNIIHSPDLSKESTLDELKILLEDGIINDNNSIPFDMLEKMKKYRTFNFQQDMRVEGYKGDVRPNISGWIQSQIKDDLEFEIS